MAVNSNLTKEKTLNTAYEKGTFIYAHIYILEHFRYIHTHTPHKYSTIKVLGKNIDIVIQYKHTQIYINTFPPTEISLHAIFTMLSINSIEGVVISGQEKLKCLTVASK